MRMVLFITGHKICPSCYDNVNRLFCNDSLASCRALTFCLSYLDERNDMVVESYISHEAL